MRKAADMLGLTAYLFLMLGRPPDGELLGAVFRGELDPEDGVPLRLVEGSGAREGRAAPEKPRTTKSIAA